MNRAPTFGQKGGRSFSLRGIQGYTEQTKEDTGVEQAYGTLMQAEVGLKDPNLGTHNQFPAAISSPQQCKPPVVFTSPSFYLSVFATDTS